MNNGYEGPERREIQRRAEDRRHCALHEVLWGHHDEERKDFRKTVCGKLGDIKTTVEKKADEVDLRQVQADLKSMVPWKAFGLAAIIVLSGFGYLVGTIKDGQKEIKEGVATIHRRISEQNTEYDKMQTTITDLQHSLNDIVRRLTGVEKQLEKK